MQSSNKTTEGLESCFHPSPGPGVSAGTASNPSFSLHAPSIHLCTKKASILWLAWVSSLIPSTPYNNDVTAWTMSGTTVMLFEFHSVYAAVLKIKVKTKMVCFSHLSADRFTATNMLNSTAITLILLARGSRRTRPGIFSFRQGQPTSLLRRKCDYLKLFLGIPFLEERQ